MAGPRFARPLLKALGSKMEFEESYQIVIEKWPSEVDITEVKLHSNGGAAIPELTAAHDKVEEQCFDLDRSVLAMDWSLFQYFHAKAKDLYSSGIFTLKTNEIDMERLKGLYIENSQ